MPRQRTHHSRITHVFPDDFPQRLVRFKAESGLSWVEIARRLGTYPYTVNRWWKEGVRPHFRHLMALLELAEALGLAHLLTAWKLPEETPSETPAPAAPSRLANPWRKAARRRGGGDRRD